MAIVERVIPATQEQIFAVLADGWSYSDWVVGTVHIRSVQDEFPAPGSVLRHKVGPWPLSLHDNTKIIACDRPRRLAMEARIRPLGVATVTLEVTAIDERHSKVTMREEFAAGPLQWIQNKINDLVLHQRNKESLSRLSDLAIGRRNRHSEPRSPARAT
jgi:uncharacterized protein YndB with AHSA1/START domain